MKLFLTLREVWELEGYGGKCAIIGVIGAMVFAISLAFVTEDMPRNKTSEVDPVVQEQVQKQVEAGQPYKAEMKPKSRWIYIVVRSSDW